jgi:hypothetical protein
MKCMLLGAKGSIASCLLGNTGNSYFGCTSVTFEPVQETEKKKKKRIALSRNSWNN